MNNKQKFVHYVMLTFTYSVGAVTAAMILFTIMTVIKDNFTI